MCWALLALGCSYEQAQFTYGKAEMEGQVIGTWTGSWWASGQEVRALTLEVESKNDPSVRKTACSRQTFSESAPGVELRCGATSSLALSGLLTLEDGPLSATPLSGSYEIWSLNLGPGSLSLSSSDGSSWLSATQNQDLAWTDCTIRDGSASATCTLDVRE